jgi:hypothetical protein
VADITSYAFELTPGLAHLQAIWNIKPALDVCQVLGFDANQEKTENCNVGHDPYHQQLLSSPTTVSITLSPI